MMQRFCLFLIPIISGGESDSMSAPFVVPKLHDHDQSEKSHLRHHTHKYSKRNSDEMSAQKMREEVLKRAKESIDEMIRRIVGQ